MRFLITGGAGFIGSHLAEFLLGEGHQVAAIDDLSTGSARNVAHLKGRRGFSFTKGTVMDPRLVRRLAEPCGAIFHLAAAVGVRLIVESPVRTIETNIRATDLVLDVAVRGKKKVLIASTSEVYGKSAAVPFREDGDLVLGPTSKSRWSYACSKAIDEFLGLAYLKERGVPVVIARLFNTVGPRQTGRYGMVVPNFVQQALSGKPITVFGTGRQTRCFTHVTDCVRALYGLIREPKAVGGVFNIGSQREVSINELASMVKARTQSRSPIKHVPYEKAYEEGFEDMPRRVPDLTRISRLIGYKPTRTLEQIIDDVAAYQANIPRGT